MTVKKIWNSSEDRLSQEQVEMVFEKLSPLTNVDEAVKEAHVRDIENKYKNGKQVDTQSRDETVAEVSDLVCPRCGSKLILRTAKKGTNVGNQFYGCSAFPKCRYIKNI